MGGAPERPLSRETVWNTPSGSRCPDLPGMETSFVGEIIESDDAVFWGWGCRHLRRLAKQRPCGRTGGDR